MMTSERIWQAVVAGLLLTGATAGPAMSQEPYSPPQGSSNQFPADEPNGAGGSRRGVEYESAVPVGGMTANGGSVPASGGDCTPPPRPGFWTRSRWGLAGRSHSPSHHQYGPCEASACECAPLPVGFTVNEYRDRMRASGRDARMMLYRQDFVEGTDELTPKGLERLAEMAVLLPSTFAPLIIEHTPDDPQLAERRRQAVFEGLRRVSIPVAQERLVVGTARFPELRGVEAEVISRRLMKQTAYGGSERLGTLSAGSSFAR